MLTGQALKDFEVFYRKKHYGAFRFSTVIDEVTSEPETVMLDLFDLPMVFSQGVILEWLRSVGKIVEVFSQLSKPKLTFGFKIVEDSGNLLEDGLPDYNTALIEAITKAVSIYNGAA